MGDPDVRRCHPNGECAQEGQFRRSHGGTVMARLGINAVIEPAAEGRPRLARGRVRPLGEFPLDIEDGDVEKTHGDFVPAVRSNPAGLKWTEHGPLGVCGDGVAQRGCPCLDGQLLKNAGGSLAGKEQEISKGKE